MKGVLLLETLQSLEVALHRPEVRSNRDGLDRLQVPSAPFWHSGAAELRRWAPRK